MCKYTQGIFVLDDIPVDTHVANFFKLSNNQSMHNILDIL
jgi:hypothetical protein